MTNVELCEWTSTDPKFVVTKDKQKIISCPDRRFYAPNQDVDVAACDHPDKPGCDGCPRGFQ
ncbi:hypothetical protein A2961_03650 [Candidatus Woesebacteria bacterium RIFCSPLOWO2_01_FULL_39_21]|uniref:Uncharacterized protein n=1 Tax=Candidatus Woesebacteria bacterium RIFCSPLOWO2_01_FULL_39_21 TaxID=1802519 RepID=A0A1F8BDC9_9BACT|nr:MAG: hypothetical protein A2691_01200 [Candidatus Woesebacteria bacterium RIFCSPHIGHO2_01_FULL_39_23]OGM61375.1 MAG: hypothetical protein A2961_03650 [Candidatus Woesebacteria bacterium RIFCSPLOWO2_01_FULL_39_21]